MILPTQYRHYVTLPVISTTNTRKYGQNLPGFLSAQILELQYLFCLLINITTNAAKIIIAHVLWPFMKHLKHFRFLPTGMLQSIGTPTVQQASLISITYWFESLFFSRISPKILFYGVLLLSVFEMKAGFGTVFKKQFYVSRLENVFNNFFNWKQFFENLFLKIIIFKNIFSLFFIVSTVF